MASPDTPRPQTAESLAREIAGRCANAHRTADGWMAGCPAHDDTNPSLKIDFTLDRVLLHCFAGCSTEGIVAALGLTLADLFVDTRQGGRDDSIVTTYDYYDLYNVLVHQTVRYAGKQFRQRRPDPAQPGAWIWNLKTIHTILYQLPRVHAAIQRGEVVYVAEGEKDVDTLVALGLTATCNPMGAGKWARRYSEQLRGAHVALLPDWDDPGIRHVHDVARKLQGFAANVKIVPDIHTTASGSDVSDWLARGGTRATLEAAAAAAPFWTPTPSAPHFTASAPRHTNGAAPVAPASIDNLPYSDYTNALALVREHGHRLHFCFAWNFWLVWTGTHWARDMTGEVMRLAKQTIKQLLRLVEHMEDASAIAALMRHVKGSLSAGRLKACVELAESEPGIPVLPEDCDSHPWLLNCTNGTVDLRTGLLQPHRPAELLTRCLPFAYLAHATCPSWLAFLEQMLAGDKELLTFVQRAVGYALTGDTREQCLFLLYGTGSNGKSTFIEMVQALLGDYGVSTPSTTLLVKDRQDGIPNDIARLRGVRLVCSVEIGEGRRLNEELVKRLTGQDTMTARFLHAEFFDFMPIFKLFLACNHLPHIRGTDHAIWRRLRILPFTVKIEEADQDKTLPTTLRQELQGMLAWAVQGVLDWQRDGLRAPDAVKQATEKYRLASDVLGRFIDERCILSPRVRVKAGELYEAYKKWCDASGEMPVSLTKFGGALEEKGVTKKKDNVIWYLGIGLQTD